MLQVQGVHLVLHVLNFQAKTLVFFLARIELLDLLTLLAQCFVTAFQVVSLLSRSQDIGSIDTRLNINEPAPASLGGMVRRALHERLRVNRFAVHASLRSFQLQRYWRSE